MADDELTAYDFIHLGRKLLFLRNAQGALGTEYREAINEFLLLAKRCNFPGTTSGAETLSRITFYTHPQSGRILSNNAAQLDLATTLLSDGLTDESKRKTVIATDGKPPDELTQLTGLEPHQEALRRDLVTCLKAHVARPAIVMAWALGYDLVRSWVFNDPLRKQAFSNQIGAQVNDYHDFFHLNEYRVLSACRNSQDVALAPFTDRELRDLQSLLDQRNDFAHANFNRASINEATAYVERMVRVVTSPPFV